MIIDHQKYTLRTYNDNMHTVFLGIDKKIFISAKLKKLTYNISEKRCNRKGWLW